MFRPARTAAVDVAAELRELPAGYVTYQHDRAWFVLGPTGLFVVEDGGDDPHAAALRAATAARRLRNDIATELAWVPFVDALVVADRGGDEAQLPCLSVPARLLRHLVAGGPRTVDDATLARIVRRQLALHHG